MNRIFLLSLALIACSTLWAKDVSIEMPRSLLGRDYVIATRVEKVSRPVELGKMKIYSGLRVYNPQLVRFAVENDSLIMTAADDKKGPQRVAMPLTSRSETAVTALMNPLFETILRGTDVISGKMLTDKMLSSATEVSSVKGDANHLEVSVDYSYRTGEAEPLKVKIRKSLLLLEENPKAGRPVDARIGYKSWNSKHIDRYDITGGKPIVFYVSDEFPQQWQSAIKHGIEDWNIAFSRIGHPDAVKALRFSEAGKDFDPFDITRNCIFKVESDFANAMGCHWSDPRNGQILQADVQLYQGVLGKLNSWMLLHTGAYNNKVADGKIPEAVQQRMIRYAVAHEIGHCLGLEHNYRGSFAYPTESLRDASFCETNGTTASIMDYARFNYVAQPGDGVENVFPPLLGDYDIYAIEAGYKDMTDEQYRRFITEHQQQERCLYRKLRVTSLPDDKELQQTDLGNDHLKSTQYGIRNIAALPLPVLKALKAEEVHAFYFQLLMHLVPSLDQAEVKEYMEKELNEGYKMLNSAKMREAYGNQITEVERRRGEFVNRISKKYSLNIAAETQSAGQWMPHQMVSDDVFSLLKNDGLRLTKKQIYEANKRCLAGAALSMSVDNGIASPFATASFVSKDGLVMTNFHCVSSYVQALARGKNDYMKYGCWASSRKEEAPLFNLQLHQLLSIEDVTDRILAGTDTMSIDDRDNLADKRGREMMIPTGEAYGVSRRVYAMNGGQQYILARYRTFSDVRIVACPPMWLASYGGDEDNWKWPRYSCDFAFLRVYVGKDGNPVQYDKENVPYHPASYLQFAKESAEEGDLSMVMGYPAQSRKNIPAFALDKIVNRDIRLRATALKAKIDFLRERSKGTSGPKLSGYNVRIAKLMNIYLRSMGEIEGVSNMGLVEKKRQEDLELQQWINADEERMARYGSNLIAQIDSVYGRLTVFNHMDEAFSQFVGSGAGIIPFAGKFEKLINIAKSKRKSRDEDLRSEAEDVRRNVREFFPSISMEEDCGMMKTLLPIYLKAVSRKYLPKVLQNPVDIDRLYATSLLTDSARLERLLDECVEKGMDELAKDSLYRICMDVYITRVQKQNREATPLRRLNTKLYGIYTRAKTEKDNGHLAPYQANHTLRFSTGRVKDFTFVKDMAERKDSVSAKFKALLKEGNDLPVACFSTSAETSSGNSGSAVLNSKGRIIGINFDRTAVSASSVYRFDPLTMRNIVVSKDYILWVIRNLSHSQYILKELE